MDRTRERRSWQDRGKKIVHRLTASARCRPCVGERREKSDRARTQVPGVAASRRKREAPGSGNTRRGRPRRDETNGTCPPRARARRSSPTDGKNACDAPAKSGETSSADRPARGCNVTRFRRRHRRRHVPCDHGIKSYSRVRRRGEISTTRRAASRENYCWRRPFARDGGRPLGATMDDGGQLCREKCGFRGETGQAGKPK